MDKKIYEWTDFEVHGNVIAFILFIISWCLAVLLTEDIKLAALYGFSAICLGCMISFGKFELRDKK